MWTPPQQVLEGSKHLMQQLLGFGVLLLFTWEFMANAKQTKVAANDSENGPKMNSDSIEACSNPTARMDLTRSLHDLLSCVQKNVISENAMTLSCVPDILLAGACF